MSDGNSGVSGVKEPSSRDIRRVILASVLGNALEWYDFFLYGFLAALVFSQLFFPAGTDPLIGTMGAFVGFAMGFLARPFGGIIFAHIGDRYGRKRALIGTLTLMGGATFLMGALPTYAQIGIWAPIIVAILRILQGIATGGEWGGAVLLVTENVPEKRKGFYSSFGQAGLSLGFVLAAGAFFIVQQFPKEDFISWGWRLPFLISLVIFAVGIFIRSRIPETADFKKAEQSGRKARVPLLQVLKQHPKAVLTAAGLRVAENGGSYIFVAFSLTYAKFLGISGSDALLAMIISYIIQIPVLLWLGSLSDRVGVWPLYFFGAVGMALFAFPFFWLMEAKSFSALLVAYIGANTVFIAAMNAVQPKLFSSLFSAEVRYSGLALGHEVAAVFSGGLSPLIATALLAGYSASWPIALYLAALAAVTAITLLLVRPASLSRQAAAVT